MRAGTRTVWSVVVNATGAGFGEEHIRAAFDRGDFQLAATTLLRAYGGEIFGFIVGRLKDTDFASEVFADFAEDLWRGLHDFRWNCSARGWAYTLARHATSRGIRQRRRRAARSIPLSRVGPISELAQLVCTQTTRSLGTRERSRVAALREQLSIYEQTLLTLRVNRELPWVEIARVLAGGPLESVVALSPEQLHTEAARHRKRFQKAKEKLRKLATEAGLLSD